ncbi:MAG: carbon storage regulator [Nanoarchaeota archaeon]
MLVLSRQRDEVIYINGEEIKITVVDIRGEKVRLGIEAPPHMPVYRKEVYERIKLEQQEKGVANPYIKSLAGRKENLGELEGEVEK